jgi:predicted RNA-binding Zn-ribbon protein involved in translation (DUF1610 family)
LALPLAECSTKPTDCIPRAFFAGAKLVVGEIAHYTAVGSKGWNMSQNEVKKTCKSCGADVAHKERHKHRDGTYTCPKCRKEQKGSSQRVFEGLTGKKLRLVIFYVILVVVACLIFWKILDYVNQSGFLEN